MATQIANQVKYANLQLAAEAFFLEKTACAGDVRESSFITVPELKEGNTRSSKFTDEAAAEFALDWEIVEHQANTSTGFSGTLFRALRTDEARGILAGELVMSFRSTEFLDDSARDNQATNTLEIKEFGWAFGQMADMENWYAHLKSTGKIGLEDRFSLTGYSLGGHLATACACKKHTAARSLKRSICYKNSSCLRNIYKRCSPKTLVKTTQTEGKYARTKLC